MDINYFMTHAIKEANKASLNNEVPVGAILVDNLTNKIIASAHNQTIKQQNPLKHAEILIIDQACKERNSKYLNDTSLFVTLEPCAMCSAAICEARIKNVYFGAYDDKNLSLESILQIYKTKNYYIPDTYGGINDKECSKIIINFFKKKRSEIV